MTSPTNLSDLIGPDSEATVEAQATVEGTRYVKLAETNALVDTSGETIVSLDDNGVGTIVASDSVLTRSSVPAALADAFNLPVRDDEPEPTPDGAEWLASQASKDKDLVFRSTTMSAGTLSQPSALSIEDMAKLVHEAAVAASETLSSKHAPGTSNGRLACAWAVNSVVQGALGAPVGGDLATADMVKMLRRHHFPIKATDKHAGCIIIAATVTGVKIGHVGIVGNGDEIYSNSSSRAIFRKGPTLSAWKSTYSALETEYFELNPLRFPIGKATN